MRTATSQKERWLIKAAEWNPELSSKYRTNRSIGRPRKKREDDINEFLKQIEDETELWLKAAPISIKNWNQHSKKTAERWTLLEENCTTNSVARTRRNSHNRSARYVNGVESERWRNSRHHLTQWESFSVKKIERRSKMVCSSFSESFSSSASSTDTHHPMMLQQSAAEQTPRTFYWRATSQEQRDGLTCEQSQEQLDGLTFKNKVKYCHQDVAKIGHIQLRSRLKTWVLLSASYEGKNLQAGLMCSGYLSLSFGCPLLVLAPGVSLGFLGFRRVWTESEDYATWIQWICNSNSLCLFHPLRVFLLCSLYCTSSSTVCMCNLPTEQATSVVTDCFSCLVVTPTLTIVRPGL